MPTVICLPLKILRAQKRVSPDDSTRFHRSTPHRKNFRFAFQPITLTTRAVPPRREAYALSSRNVRRDVVDTAMTKDERHGGLMHQERPSSPGADAIFCGPPNWPHVFRRTRQGPPKLRNSGAWSHASGRAAHRQHLPRSFRQTNFPWPAPWFRPAPGDR